MRKQITWDALNAYVDGELSPVDAAEIAKAVAEDSDLAARVARLSTLKAAFYSLRPVDRPAIELDSSSKQRTWLPWVASLAVFTLLGAILGGVMLARDQAISPAEIARAEAVHHEWLTSTKRFENEDQSEVLDVSMEILQLDAYVPDLSNVNLVYDGIRKISIRSGEGLHIGYRGPHGCMVSLVVFHDPRDLSANIKALDRGDRIVYGWRVHQTGFYLLASRMDPNRLSEIAKVVYRITQTKSPLDAQSILALNKAKASSQPCTA
ncbi:MAG: hypothetical protein ABFS22_09175 [Pseudomonadota bacterium]